MLNLIQNLKNQNFNIKHQVVVMLLFVSGQACLALSIGETNIEELLTNSVIHVKETVSPQKNTSIGGTTLNVINDNNAGPGTLRTAIETASDNDTIVFDPIFFTTPRQINLLTALPLITVSLTIQGPGANLLTIRRADDAGDMRIFDIVSGLSIVRLSGMTVSNGKISSSGGGIRSSSNLTLENMYITGNYATNGGGVAMARTGGQFFNTTISGNSAIIGGGIRSFGGDGGSLRLNNCTITQNKSDGASGGGVNFETVTDDIFLQIASSTIADNLSLSSDTVSNGINVRADGAGNASVTLLNTIVANNGPINFSAISTGGGTAAISTLGFNLSNDYNGNVTTNNTDLIGDPKLGPLAPYGGPVPVRLLLADSPAIDAGVLSAISTDQRFLPRPFDIIGIPNGTAGSIDIGAVEMQGIIVSNTDDTGIGSLRDAITKANNNGSVMDDILFDKAVFGTPKEITLSTELPEISTPLTISGAGADRITVSRSIGSSPFRIFTVDSGLSQVAISGMTLKNGSVNDLGGGISSSSPLTLANVHILDNNAETGGGVSQLLSGGTYINSTFSGNTSTLSANAIFVQDTRGTPLRIINSTISGNSGGESGGIKNVAISNVDNSVVEVINSTITNNSGSASSGITLETLGNDTNSEVHIRNSIIANNTPNNFHILNQGGFTSITSLGFNLTDTENLNFLDHPTDQNSANSELAPLANNGGSTPTHALRFGSDALDGGDNSGSGLMFDQRGNSLLRTINLPFTNLGDGSDVGAFEAQTEPLDSIFMNGFEN